MYVGKSALEIKLRETPIASAYGNDGPTPTPVVALSTERIACAPVDLPVANAGRAESFAPVVEDQIPRHAILTKSTIAGLCLTAFACGIITTVTFDHQRLRALERQVHAQAEALVASTKPSAAAPPPAAELAPKAPAPEVPADPIVQQLPPAPAVSAAPPVEAAAAETAPDKLADALPVRQKTTGVRLAAARTPRPPAPRAAVRRRSTPPAESAATTDQSAAAPWVDPFAE